MRASAYALSRGIILADTKFEWGKLPGGEIILIDEVLTPDSSRFWPVDGYQVGGSPPRSTSNSCAIGWKARHGRY